jgi:hypothetical protein
MSACGHGLDPGDPGHGAVVGGWSCVGTVDQVRALEILAWLR